MYLTVETERLLIRPISLNDASFIINLLNSEGWQKFIGDRGIKTEKDAKQYIQQILEREDFFYSVFELKDSISPIGMVSLRLRQDERYPDIGFALLSQFEKKGYALEATKAYLEKIKTSMKYDNIIGITNSENKKSIKLLQNLGLAYAGDFLKKSEKLSYYSLDPTIDISFPEKPQ